LASYTVHQFWDLCREGGGLMDHFFSFGSKTDLVRCFENEMDVAALV
jgi:hypothetical protein